MGVSQSLPGLQALRFAVTEARRRGMALQAVRAWASPSSTRSRSTVLWCDSMAFEARRYVTDTFDTALGGVPEDIELTITVSTGRADVVLKDLAVDDSDLLVVGAPVSRWTSRTVRGCTRGARCPVIVVPPPELARALRRISLRRLVQEIKHQR